MEEEFTITFFQIMKCGFYKNGKHMFGSLQEVLPSLKSWAESVKLFVDTQLLDDDRKDSFGNEVRDVFYYDYCGDTKSSLLVLWNRILDVDGEVPTLSKDKQIGDTTLCEITTLPQNAIPGTAAYFWFIPEKNCFATVERKNRYSNVAGMRKYLQTFIAQRSSFCVVSDTQTNTDEIKIVGYKNPTDNKVTQDVVPYFQAVRSTKKEQLEYIKQNRIKIRKVIRKQKTIDGTPARYTFAQNLLMAMGVKHPQTGNNSVSTKYEVTYTPTDAELKQLVDNWQKNGLTSFDDTGFIFTGDNNTHWLSGAVSRLKKNWTATYKDKEVIDPISLLYLINSSKDDLLSALP